MLDLGGASRKSGATNGHDFATVIPITYSLHWKATEWKLKEAYDRLNRPRCASLSLFAVMIDLKVRTEKFFFAYRRTFVRQSAGKLL